MSILTVEKLTLNNLAHLSPERTIQANLARNKIIDLLPDQEHDLCRLKQAQ